MQRCQHDAPDTRRSPPETLVTPDEAADHVAVLVHGAGVDREESGFFTRLRVLRSHRYPSGRDGCHARGR